MKAVFSFISPVIELTVPVLVASVRADAPIVAASHLSPVIAVQQNSRERAIALFDAINSIDLFTIVMTRGIADGVGTSDTSTLKFGKAPADIATMTDQIASFLLARQLQDTAALSEVAAKVLTKQFLDSLTVIEAFQYYTAGNSSPADNATADEIVSMMSGKALADTASANEGGFVFVSDYLPFDYFDTPYIGTSRVF